MFDLVIRNGLVVDGSGLAPYHADIGVTDGVIRTIGRITDRGATEIDAEGHAVTPGFIDGHTHMDAQVMWDPLGTSSCWHGVTTVVMGNCGFTLAPSRADEREFVVRNLERAEDISAEAMDAGIEWNFESFDEYLGVLEGRPKGINYAAYVGHSALRTWAMGERAFSEAAGPDDLDAIERELRRALDAGAVGLSTSRSEHHMTSAGHPVSSRAADWTEVDRLVQVVGSYPGRLFELALPVATRSADPREREGALDRIRSLASYGATVTFGVQPTTVEGFDWRSQLACIDAGSAAGGRMFGQAHSRGVSSVLSFRTHLPFDRLPGWAEIRALPLEAQEKALLDEDTRRRLVEEARTGSYGEASGAETRPPDYDRMLILESGLPPNPSVRDTAAARGMDPVELIIELGLGSGFDQMFIQPIGRTEPDALLEIMRHPRTVMTFSDSGAHVSQILDASIQTHLLGYWVRQAGAFSFEEAVRMITFEPARAWGFADRGLVREGMRADLNVLDPQTIAPQLPKVVHDLPGGAVRLVQKSAGILATVVNGVPVLQGGEHTGALPGMLLRRAPQAA